MSDCVWLVQGGFFNSVGFRCVESDENDYPPPEVQEAASLVEQRHHLPEDRYPRDNYLPGTNRRTAGGHLPHIFSNGFIFISGKSAEVLRQFDLGEGALYPAHFYHPDRKTLWRDDYFYLSQGNRKNAFLPEESPEAKKVFHVEKKLWSPPPIPVDDQLVFSPGALEGPDIWWDERISFFFLICDAMAQALKLAGVAKDWMLLRCPVVASQNGVAA